MGEVSYVWADPGSGASQLAISSVVQAMLARNVIAIARYVSRDGMDPKMGVLVPRAFEDVDCFLWMTMPFADDVRRYTFPSLTRLVNKKGEKVESHAYLPTAEQEEVMERFVDAMDLMQSDVGREPDASEQQRLIRVGAGRIAFTRFGRRRVDEGGDM